MSFTKMSKNVLNISALDNKPKLIAEELKAMFDKAGGDIKEFVNNLIDEIASLEGASNIGIDKLDESDESEANIQAKLIEVARRLNIAREEMNSVALGQIPNGSITEEKLDEELNNKIVKQDELEEDLNNLETKIKDEVVEVGDIKIASYPIKDDNYLFCDGSIISIEDYPLLKHKLFDLNAKKIGYIDRTSMSSSAQLYAREVCYSKTLDCYVVLTQGYVYSKTKTDTVFLLRHSGLATWASIFEKDGIFYLFNQSSSDLFLFLSSDGITFTQVAKFDDCYLQENFSCIIDDTIYLSVSEWADSTAKQGYVYCKLSEITNIAAYQQSYYLSKFATSIRKVDNKIFGCYGTTSITIDHTTTKVLPYVAYDIYYLNGIYYILSDRVIYSTTDLEDSSKYINITNSTTPVNTQNGVGYAVTTYTRFKYIDHLGILMTSNGYILEDGIFKATELIFDDNGSHSNKIGYDGEYIYGQDNKVSIDGKIAIIQTNQKTYSQGKGENFVWTSVSGEDVVGSSTIYIPSKTEVYLPNPDADIVKYYIRVQ